MLALGPDPKRVGIGINHRNLRTFEMDMDLALNLYPRIPENYLVVAESGLRGPEDLNRLQAGGIHAFLIGGSLAGLQEPQRGVEKLLGRR